MVGILKIFNSQNGDLERVINTTIKFDFIQNIFLINQNTNLLTCSSEGKILLINFLTGEIEFETVQKMDEYIEHRLSTGIMCRPGRQHFLSPNEQYLVTFNKFEAITLAQFQVLDLKSKIRKIYPINEFDHHKEIGGAVFIKDDHILVHQKDLIYIINVNFGIVLQRFELRPNFEILNCLIFSDLNFIVTHECERFVRDEIVYYKFDVDFEYLLKWS